ncbi:hypothetical protein JTE90_013345 [Oedothorax gibbosus]|uniref:Uncharacterized protein n=1 Tax=Oedothorax gibbosus TaxID=931172 RepID=A0AAV6VCV0_9ARAC|nr:hypothetical protein JTE90_013345 [Oedothorax gibbosus]
MSCQSLHFLPAFQSGLTSSELRLLVPKFPDFCRIFLQKTGGKSPFTRPRLATGEWAAPNCPSSGQWVRIRMRIEGAGRCQPASAHAQKNP